MAIDYIAITLQGFSTGIGVIAAHEAYDWFKKYKENIKKNTKDFLNGNGSLF
jgi:hypothetical protein